MDLVIPDLRGKSVLITGASTGIGAALARAFAAQGAHVGVNYHASEGPAKALVAEIERHEGMALLLKGDVTKAEDCETMVARMVETFRGVDGLINNAGLMLGRVDSLKATDAHLSAVIDLNARSVVTMTRAARPWLARRGGFVINTSSIAARNGGANGAFLYAAAKGFVSTLTRGLAKELIGENIRVNGVSPGVIATPFHDRYSTPEALQALAKTIPAGRLGTAEECVGAYLFLASEKLSSYVVGQILEVNGGQLMP
jgi:3-oxoacyl-[acyl-carrier protein] reductase